MIAPLDVVKIRLQIQNDSRKQGIKDPSIKYHSILQTMKTIIKEEGSLALFKGNLPAEYLYLAYGAVQFCAYHAIDDRLKEFHWNPSLEKFISGSLSGGLATFATYPLDVIRTRFAMQGKIPFYSSTWDALHTIYQMEGFKGLYRGIWPSMLSVFIFNFQEYI